MSEQTENPTYEQLSALCAQMAEALDGIVHFSDGFACYWDAGSAGKALREWVNEANAALTAYRTLSPDPQWQRVPEVTWEQVHGWMFEHDQKMAATFSVATNEGIARAVAKKFNELNRARGEG